jgi:SAM-dependent methyltransferase
VSESAVRVNLGSGNEPLKGWVNVDRRSVSGVDVVADVTMLPFRDGSIDEVLASSLLEHFRDPYEVLASIHRVLAPAATFTMRVPSPWSYSGILDTTHFFLADLKLWREILSGYFATVQARGEGVRHRDHKPLAAVLHFCVKVLRMTEFAQTWLIRCQGPLASTRRAYVPWWLEERYGRDPRMQLRADA